MPKKKKKKKKKGAPRREMLLLCFLPALEVRRLKVVTLFYDSYLFTAHCRWAGNRSQGCRDDPLSSGPWSWPGGSQVSLVVASGREWLHLCPSVMLKYHFWMWGAVDQVGKTGNRMHPSGNPWVVVGVGGVEDVEFQSRRVGLGPLKRYVYILTPGNYECGFLWKSSLCRCN